MTRPYKLLKADSVKDILKMPDKIPTQKQIILDIIQNSKKELTTTDIYTKTPTISPRTVRDLLVRLVISKAITKRVCECGCTPMYKVRKN